MPIDTSATTIDSPQGQEEAASLFQRGRNSARRLQKSPLAEVDATLAQASVAANKAYKSMWDTGGDILEKGALGFWTLGNFLVGPIVFVVYLLRIFVGSFQHGGFTIGFRTFQVRAIPGIQVFDLKRHAMAIGLSLLFLLQIVLLIILFKAATDPVYMAKLGLCATFHATCK